MIPARSSRGLLLAIPLAVLAVACGGSAPPAASASSNASTPATPTDESAAMHGHGHHAHAPDGANDPVDAKLDAVARIHGAPGPWAVAGYRMSEHALGKLGLARGSFDVQIVHWTPKEVRYSCIADGAAAHSGASLGKLNLSLVDAKPEDVLTVYRDKKSGRAVALRPSASFRKRYADTPRDKARELGREVLLLPDADVFEEVSVTRGMSELPTSPSRSEAP